MKTEKGIKALAFTPFIRQRVTVIASWSSD
jgi:hypothetical protein